MEAFQISISKTEKNISCLQFTTNVNPLSVFILSNVIRGKCAVACLEHMTFCSSGIEHHLRKNS